MPTLILNETLQQVMYDKVQQGQAFAIHIGRSENATFDSATLSYFFLEAIASSDASNNFVMQGENLNVISINKNQILSTFLSVNQHLVSQ